MTDTASTSVVRVQGLTVKVADKEIVSDVSFEIAGGEILGLVGQSGSGKTTVSMALLGYTRRGARLTDGAVEVAGVDVRALSAAQLRAFRGRRVTYVPQDPRASLNPALTVRRQLAEVLVSSPESLTKEQIENLILECLGSVGLPATREFARRYPHQLSGGQLQRVGIAMAIIDRPEVLVLDEPTTGLDVTTQRRILDLVRGLCTEYGIAGLYVTHDLSVIAEIADRVIVMHDGVIVEEGEVETVFEDPRDEYTRRLLRAAPDINAELPPRTAPEADAGRVLAVADLDAGYRRNQVLHDLTFELGRGECLAIVGESGSGKSTLSRAIIGLHPQYTGRILWQDRELPRRAARRSREMVKDLQYIFQSPFTALNPRMTVEESVGFAHRMAFHATAAQRRAAVRDAVERVHLPANVLTKLPGSLSGGERQRVAIARALVTEPSILVCDEVTASLDVLIQASIIDLLAELKREGGLSLLFVTHDLALVRSFADRVLVLERGRIVEIGETATVLRDPQAPYTQRLVGDALSIRQALEGRRTPAL
ncbi:ABC transporter ATP-binding protein [Microbacterium gorillae]|uniref:ABC transporter ATP-binding protein n=1 Tax=Microbacterium gorillae TaxID=1231063 RepID=UPI000694087C|nr:ABC transporter ATP-binding protein [Microbacterium gorillae]